MRRLAIALLLLGTATPAFAIAEPGSSAPRVERAERPSIGRAVRERMRSAEPRVAREAPASVRVSSESAQPERPDRPPRAERVRERVGQAVSPGASAPPVDTVSGWRSRERAAEWVRRGVVSPVLGQGGATGASAIPPIASQPSRQETRRRIGDFLRDHAEAERWRQDWRRDDRYNWRRHRDWYGYRYRLGYYDDPWGWNYRRWNIGYTMPSVFWSRRHWIHDPWHFRLPAVSSRYRWVRYWDDALLIDLRTGRVVDVIHDFFW